MINYTITINGEEVEPTVPFSATIDGTEDFDIGNMYIKNSKSTKYEEYDDVVINIDDQWVINLMVESDLVVQLAANYYEHKLTLIEHTAFLSTFEGADRYFYLKDDGTPFTYWEILERLRLTARLGKDAPHNEVLSSQTPLYTELQRTATEVKFEGKNYLDKLRQLYRGFNAVPRLFASGNLGLQYFDTRNNPITYDNNSSRNLSSSIANYASTVKTKAKNVTYGGELATGGVYFPSKDYGITPRSSSVKYDDANMRYELNRPIRLILEVVIMNLEVDGVGTVQANISDWINTKQEFDNLPLGGRDELVIWQNKSQRNTLYYEVNGNTLENMSTQFKTQLNALWGQTDVMEMLVKSWLYEHPTYDTTDYVSQNLRDYELRFFFQPYFDIDITQDRWDRINKRTTFQNNQSAKILDIGRYSRVHRNLVNMMGNGNVSIEVKHDSYTDRYELFDYTNDDYRIIKATYDFYPNHIVGTYELSKNYMSINGIQSTNRENYPYTILRDNVFSNFVLTNYIEFSFTQKAPETGLTLQGRRTLLNVLDYDASDDLPVYHVQLDADGSNQGSDKITASAVGLPDNGITMAFGFESETIAGRQLVTESIDVGNEYYMNPIRYTRESGYMEDFRAFFCSTLPSFDGDDYPLTPSTTTALVNTGFIDVYKNPNEILGFTQEFQFATDSPQAIIVGEWFARRNNLVRLVSLQFDFRVYVYDQDTRFTIFDTEIKSGWTSVSSINDFTVVKPTDLSNDAYIDVSNIATTANATWAIGVDDNLVLAVNYFTTQQRVYINDLLDVDQLDEFLTVQFNSAGGTEIPSQEVLFGTVIQEPTEPTRDKYLFDGWNVTFPYTVVDNVTITAQWLPAFGSASIGMNISIIPSGRVSKFNGSADMNLSLSITPSGFIKQIDSDSADVNLGLTITPTGHISQLNGNGAIGLGLNITPSGSITQQFTTENDSASIGLSISITPSITLPDNEFLYIGTTGTQDFIIDLGSSGTASCRTQSTVDTVLKANYDANNYNVGDVIKIEHSYEDPTFGTSPCSEVYYYRIKGAITN